MIEVHQGRFLLMWGMSLSVPIATGVAILRGQLKGESREDFQVRVGIGLLVWLASWLLVFSTIAVPEYFASARQALRVAWETSYWETIIVLVLPLIAAAGIIGRHHRRSALDEATRSNTESLVPRVSFLPLDGRLAL
jgi:hypothetical protein